MTLEGPTLAYGHWLRFIHSGLPQEAKTSPLLVDQQMGPHVVHQYPADMDVVDVSSKTENKK